MGTEQANILRFPAGEEVGTLGARRAMETAMAGRHHLSSGGQRGAIVGSAGLGTGEEIPKPLPPRRIAKFSPAGSRALSRSSSLLSNLQPPGSAGAAKVTAELGDMRM